MIQEDTGSNLSGLELQAFYRKGDTNDMKCNFMQCPGILGIFT